MASEVHMATAEDDRRHAPGPDSLPMWNESYWFAFYDAASEVGATLRLGMHQNQNEANLYLMLVRGGEVAHTLIDTHAALPAVQEDHLSLHGYTIDIERPLERFRLRYKREGYDFDLVWEGISPTYLYPNPAYGTVAELKDAVQKIHNADGKVMFYTLYARLCFVLMKFFRPLLRKACPVSYRSNDTLCRLAISVWIDCTRHTAVRFFIRQ